MRILIISHFFAPYQVMGAIRMSKLAKFWHQRGHEVRVIAGNNQPFPRTLPLEIPVSQVYYTHWLYLNAIERLVSRKANPKPQDTATPKPGPNLRDLGAFYYKTLTNFPDGYIGWYPWALSLGRELLRSWQPDFILASAPPNTGMMLASRLAKEFGIPWFADFRDLWMDDPYRSFPFQYPHWRVRLESLLEQATLKTAKGFTTVSPPLVETLQSKFKAPVQLVMNGFDAADYPTAHTPSKDGLLNILYTGQIFQGGRNPTALFEALQRLGEKAKRVRVKFFAPPQVRQDPQRFAYKMQAYSSHLRSIAGQYGLEQLVEVQEPVPFQQSLALQRNADVLLLLTRDDPSDVGIFTGKVFEYIGARRPILALGPDFNVAIQLVKERQMGLATNDPSQIAPWLEALIDQKQSGEIADIPSDSGADLSREAQFQVMQDFIKDQLGRWS